MIGRCIEFAEKATIRAQAIRRAAVACVVASAAATALVACGSDADSVTEPALRAECASSAATTTDGATIVRLRGFAFEPSTVRVAPGSIVLWVNCERPTVDPHTTTSDTQLWQSNSLPPGASFSHDFAQPGQFGYFCVPHPFMRGTVVVE